VSKYVSNLQLPEASLEHITHITNVKLCST